MDLLLNTKQHSETLPRLRALFNGSSKATAITKSLAALSMCFQQRVDLNELTYAVYLESLETLAPEELALAFSRAQLEPSPYFPTPGELRQLAGVETSRQRSDREAKEALAWCFWWIRTYSVEGRPTRGRQIRTRGRDERGEWHDDEYEWEQPAAIPERTMATLRELTGDGPASSGMRLLGEHPLLGKTADEYPSLGLKLSAAEKLEQRWAEAWRRSEA